MYRLLRERGYNETERTVRDVYYLLYVIIDIFSRKVVHWEIWPTENGTLAKDIAANGSVRPASIHADRGTVDDLKHRRRPALATRYRPIPFPTARVQRQPVL
jgi:transposase InsO family protein